MASKKGGPQSLQVEVNNDEEWEFLLRRVGLVVVDIYSDWCGPCLGMLGNLKKVKLETGSDYLHLAIAKSDTITALERFRQRSEPTWMFIGSGNLVKIYFGSNAPVLTRLIITELEKEIKVINGERERVSLPFNELTTEEIVKQEDIRIRKQIEKQKEESELAERQAKVTRYTMERYARQTTHLSLVIYFPQLIVEPTETVKKRTCQAAYKMMAQYDTVGVSIIDQLDIFITESMLDEVLYLCDFRVPDWFFPIMAERECIVSLIQDPSMVPPPLDDDAQPEPDASHHSISEKLGVIESKLSKLVYGHVENYQPLPNSMGAIFTVGEDSKVPGLWTPVHYLTKAAALKALFPNVIENLGIPEERLIPPSYVMIFEGTRAREVLDSAEQFASDVLRIAFFDGMEPGVSQRVANTIHELEKLGNYVISQSKMVVALERTHSDPMLVLSQLGPVYISSDVKSGTKEVETWFPPRIEVEEIPDPFGPPPPEPELPEGVFRDSVGNLVKEEFIEDEHGNARLLRTVLEYAPGMEPGEDEDEEEEDEDEEEEEGEREEVYDMMMPPSMPEIPPETQEPEASQETPAPEGGTEPAPEPETPA